jgi:hypothetical protein
MMGRLAEEPVLRVLEPLEHIDPGASLLRGSRELPEGEEKIHRVRAAIRIEAEVARPRGTRACPARVCARGPERVLGDEQFHRVEERLKLGARTFGIGHGARG